MSELISVGISEIESESNVIRLYKSELVSVSEIELECVENTENGL